MANFTKPMKWNNKGIEPSETLKNQGFKGGYKPPAEVFNYFLNNSEICIDELQKASDKAQSTADSAKASADKAQNTASSAATAASSAQSTAESAGTAAALAQATAEKAQSTAEGKADSTHKHKKSDIIDFPTSMTPTSHASVNATYGAGNGSDYGHVKLSDSTNSSSGESNGIAATPAAVKSAKTAADEANNTIKELLKDVTLSGSKLTFTKSNGNEITVTFENATDNKSGQMSNTDKKNLDKLVEQAFTDVAIDFDTLTITFSSLNQQQDINLKDYFTSKTKQFKTGTRTNDGTELSISGGSQFMNCGFEPKTVKLYHNSPTDYQYGDNKYFYNCIVLWWENGETIFAENELGNLADTIETTSDGFYFNAPGAAINFNLRWEAYA